jgi:hypothetical protein
MVEDSFTAFEDKYEGARAILKKLPNNKKAKMNNIPVIKGIMLLLSLELTYRISFYSY